MRYLAPLVLFLFACGSQKNLTHSNMKEIDVQKATIIETKKEKVYADPFVIQSAKITGNQIQIIVTTFSDLNTTAFTLTGDSTLAKSLPPIRSIQLSTDFIPVTSKSGNLTQKELTMYFDISELAYKKESGSQIYLQFEGANERLLYTYQ
ncbi:MAG: hypothetical protein NWR96_08485 [Crocinitomicaceae bacterium]|jgi:hypothetical protein|nr:hypothetical protein [Crocinitomicaceae bacterium]MDP4761658.1 hypothetical protein [Crocinitomicaceae bacterium]